MKARTHLIMHEVGNRAGLLGRLGFGALDTQKENKEC